MMHLVRRGDWGDITIKRQNEKNDREHMKSTTKELPARYYGSSTRYWPSRNRDFGPHPGSCLERLLRIDRGGIHTGGKAPLWEFPGAL